MVFHKCSGTVPSMRYMPSTADPTGQEDCLVGNPNVGKSVIFRLLTGSYVLVSNFPGTTVEISEESLTPEVLLSK